MKVKNPLHVSEGQIRKKLRCHFCKKIGHFKKDCLKRKKWFEKKCIHYVSICLKSNNTGWLDSGSTIHVSHIMQEFRMIQPISRPQKFLYMGIG